GDYRLVLDLTTPPPPPPDVSGPTLATAFDTGLGPANGLFTRDREAIGGDSPQGARDLDIYQLQAVAGQLVTAPPSRPPGGADLDPVLRLFDSACTQLAINDDFGGSRYSQIAFLFTTEGTYFIGVSHSANRSYNPNTGDSVVGRTGDYRLVLDLSTPEPDAIGDTIATAFDTNLGPAGGTFTRPSERIGDGAFTTLDVDLYQFQAVAGQRLVATTSRPPGGQAMDTFLRLFSSRVTVLAVNDDFDGLYSQITFTFTTDDTYLIGVSGFANFAYN